MTKEEAVKVMTDYVMEYAYDHREADADEEMVAYMRENLRPNMDQVHGGIYDALVKAGVIK